MKRPIVGGARHILFPREGGQITTRAVAVQSLFFRVVIGACQHMHAYSLARRGFSDRNVTNLDVGNFMLMRLFRSLMPREERFVENFVAHSGYIVAAADALAAMMAPDQEDRPARGREVCEIESAADGVARRTLIALHRAFITPFDRSDILSLSNALDDAVDQVEEVVLHAALYKVTDFDDHMRRITEQIQQSARLVAEMMPLLHNISGNAELIRRTCEAVAKIEGDADEALREALSDLIEQRPDTITFFGRKEVYELLEGATDSLDDVADVIEGLVLDHV